MMRDSIHPAGLARSWRARLLAATLLLCAVSAAGCTGSSSTSAAATASGEAADVVSNCLLSPASCLFPHVFQVAYGLQPLLNQGIDGRGETVTVLDVSRVPAETSGTIACGYTASGRVPPRRCPAVARRRRQHITKLKRR
jgi:hypothetical protein